MSFEMAKIKFKMKQIVIQRNNTVYKNGTQTSRITLPISGMHPTYLLLRKQRFFCKSCERSFTAQTPLVKKHCFISEQTKALITIKTSEAQSITSIARDCVV